MKKALRGDANSARWLFFLSKADPKIFASPQTPFLGGAGRPKFNQLEMVTTFTYNPSLVRIDAGNFELSWLQTHKQTPTHRQDRLQYTAPQLARSVTMFAR